jgi:hypothetical protein
MSGSREEPRGKVGLWQGGHGQVAATRNSLLGEFAKTAGTVKIRAFIRMPGLGASDLGFSEGWKCREE